MSDAETRRPGRTRWAVIAVMTMTAVAACGSVVGGDVSRSSSPTSSVAAPEPAPTVTVTATATPSAEVAGAGDEAGFVTYLGGRGLAARYDTDRMVALGHVICETIRRDGARRAMTEITAAVVAQSFSTGDIGSVLAASLVFLCPDVKEEMTTVLAQVAGG